MTPEQAQLVLDIVSGLDNGAITGEWPNQVCKHCDGASWGYYDSQAFRHHENCIVPKIVQLRRTVNREGA